MKPAEAGSAFMLGVMAVAIVVGLFGGIALVFELVKMALFGGQSPGPELITVVVCSWVILVSAKLYTKARAKDYR